MLMCFFDKISLWAMHHHGTLLFGVVWTTITGAASIYVALLVGQRTAPPRRAQRPLTNHILTRLQGSGRAVAALTLLAVFLAAYIAMILVLEDFAYYDDSMLTLSTLKGHNFTPAIWPEVGRFFPLGLQEFNLIRHFTDTPMGYHILTVAQLLVFCWVLLILDDEINIASRATLVIIALVTPSILISFNGFIFQERKVLLFLAGLALSIKRFERTQSIASALGAVVCAQIMMYCKETAFLLVLGFAVSRLTLRCRIEFLAGRGYGLWSRESRLDLCLISIAMLFLALYFWYIRNGNLAYAASARLPRGDVLLGYVRVDLLPWLLVTVVLGRSYLILRRRAAPLLLWDGLALSGVVCFFAYLYLSIFGVYYLAPVDLIAILYVGRFAMISLRQTRSWAKIAAMILALIVLCQDLMVSAFSLFERKNVIHANAELASVVQMQYWQGTANHLRLFFPFSGGEEIMEFGAYLNYRGVPVEGAADETAALNSVVLAEARRTRAKNAPGRPVEESPCVEWTRIWCHLDNEPNPGDLVVVLPDDEASLAEVSIYRQRGDLLFFYKPYPTLPHWLYAAFDNLHVGGESRYRYKAFLDRWMDGSVTKWK